MEFENSFGERPLERVMDSAFSSMRMLADADVVVGGAIDIEGGGSIIPINKVTMGFVTGGGEYSDRYNRYESFPFAGGSGGGMTVTPICFLVSDGCKVKVLRAGSDTMMEKWLAVIPEAARVIIQGLMKNKGKKGAK